MRLVTLSRVKSNKIRFIVCVHALVHSLVYPTLARIREFAEKRVWSQRRGLVVTHCHYVPVKRQQPINVIIDMLHSTFVCLISLLVNSNCIIGEGGACPHKVLYVITN